VLGNLYSMYVAATVGLADRVSQSTVHLPVARQLGVSHKRLQKVQELCSLVQRSPD
jgi:hypothetical protein